MRLTPAAMVAVCAGLGAAMCACQSSDVGSAPGAALGVVEADDWFYDDDGSIILLMEEAPVSTEKDACWIQAACDAFTIVSVELLPDGRLGALEFAEIPGLGLAPGEVFLCKAIVVDRASKQVSIEVAQEGEECCQMKVETLDGVVRMSCSGECDNGDTCALESEVVDQITVFTCACPAVP